MKDIVTALTEKFRRERRIAHRYVALLLALSMVTTLFVNWQLHSDGIAKTADYQCGLEEHTHTADCYPKVLVCGYEEGEPEDWTVSQPDADTITDDSFGADPEPEVALQSAEPEYIWVPHEHTADCYQEVTTEVPVLTCFEEEHVHTDDCFDPEDGSLICDKFEHTHDDSCYTIEYETEEQLVCGLEEGELVEELNPDYNPVAMFEAPVAAARPVVVAPVAEGPVHHHTDACYAPDYTADPICGLEEHHHTVNCLSDPLDGLEDESDWLDKTGTALTGMWNEDLLTVAQGQLGYEQSEKNFKLDTDDGVTVRHYSRYGQWYGNPYGAWDVMFLSYCLNYAGVPQTVVPQRAGTQALRSDLRGSDWLKDTADVQQILPGDIVFYDAATTETVTAPEQPTVSDDSPDADIALLSMDSAGTEAPQTEERTVTAETVGIVADADEAGNLTVISGNVDGKVAEVSLTSTDVTGVIDLTAAYAAQGGEQPDESVKMEDDSTYQPGPEEASGVIIWAVRDGEAGDQIALLADTDASGDKTLSGHISNVTFERKDEKGDWVQMGEGDELTDKQEIQIIVKFSLPSGTLSEGDYTMTYQLPKGIQLDEAIGNGVIKDGAGTTVGSYTIDKDGKMTLQFTDIKFASAFNGEIYIKGKVDYSAAEDGKISFENKFSMAIKKPEPTLSIQKGEVYYYNSSIKYADENGNCYIGWRVTVESPDGTYGEKVTICDVLNGNNASAHSTFVKDSIIVKKVSADGKIVTPVAPSDYTLTMSDNVGTPSGTEQNITVSGLPPLEAGEAYYLEYQAMTDSNQFPGQGAATMHNTSSASAGSTTVKQNGESTIGFVNQITKTHATTADGLIQWTVTVRAPQDVYTGFLKNFVLKDPVPAGVNLVGDIKLTSKNGKTTTLTEEQLESGYQLSTLDGNTNLFTLTYTTTVPENGGSVVNTATMVRTDGSGERKATDSVTVDANGWSLSKKHVSTEGTKSLWALDATNAAGSSAFTLTDTIGDTIENGTTTVEGVHYAIASEVQQALESGLKVYLVGETTPRSYAEVSKWLNVTYLDADGNEVQSVDATKKVMTIRNAVDTKGKARVRRIVMDELPTVEERDRTPENARWKFQNSATLTLPNGKSWTSNAEDSFHNYELFQKEVSIDGGNTYSTDARVDYEDIPNQTLRYRVTLVATANAKGQVMFVDQLPQNVTWTTGKERNKLYVDNVERAWSGGNWLLSATGDSKNKTLTVTVSGLAPGGQYNIRFEYLAQIDEDPNWSLMIPKEVTYTNTVTYSGQKRQAMTTVYKHADPLTKVATQLKDDKGNWQDQVRYTIVINPGNDTLSKDGSGKLLLEDAITVTGGKSVYADSASVKLFYYQDGYVAGNPTDRLQPVDPALYTKLEPDAGHWLRLELPDHVGLVLEYTCTLDAGSSSAPSLSNTVTLNGVQRTVPAILQTNQSHVKLTKGQLILNKQDSVSLQQLPGAEFKIQKYDKDSKSFVNVKSGTTDATGQLSFDVTDNDADTLDADVLYRIVETKAPDRYTLDKTPHYVLFYDEDSNEDFEKAYKTATGETGDLSVAVDGQTETVQKSTVVYGVDTDVLVLNIRNVYNELTVRKLWMDSSTNRPLAAEEIPLQSIEVQLCRYTEGQTAADAKVADTRTLTAGDDWTYTWVGENEIPSQDENGNKYYYFVKEVTTGLWNVKDRNNNGVQTGEITLFNYVYTAGYELPSTGGSGTAPFAAAGGALMVLALVVGAALTLKKRKIH